MKDKVIFLLGATGCGKSDLAVKLAKDFNGEVISADSVQVFKGFDIGSAKITKEEMQGVKHYGLDIKEPTIYWIYYVAIIFFYAMTVGLVLLLFVDHSKHILLIHAVGVISWLWFGATLLSLFRADYIVTKVIQKKLSNLAFGSLKFCADIDYDILHKTVLTVASSVRNKSRILALTVLILSWLVGGWFWLYVLKSSLSDQHKSYWNLAKDCIFCNEKGHFFKNIFPTQSTFVNTNAERQGK